MSGDIHQNNISSASALVISGLLLLHFVLSLHFYSCLMNPVLMHVRENIFYFYLENRILGPPKVDHVTFTTSLNILPIQINLLQLLCFFCGKRELTSAHRTLCFSITATFTKTVSTRFLFSFNIEHKLQLRSQMTQPPAAVNHRLAPWVG